MCCKERMTMRVLSNWLNGKLQSNHLFSLHLKVIQSVHICTVTERTSDRNILYDFYIFDLFSFSLPVAVAVIVVRFGFIFYRTIF